MKTRMLLAGGIALVALRAKPLFACAACYGQSDSPLAQGMNWGIFSLMAVIGTVLSGIVVFFVHVGRRSVEAGHADARSKDTAAKDV